MPESHRLFLALLTAALVIGCRDLPNAADQAAPQSITGVATYSEAPLPDRPSAGHEGDDYLYDIAREVPSYGGHQMDGKGNFMVWTTDLNDAHVLRRAIRSRIADHRIFTLANEIPPSIDVYPAAYTLLQLGAWRDVLFEAYREIGWSMLDLDEGRNRVSLGVKGGTDYSRDSELRRRIESLGIPWDAINIVVTEATSVFKRRAWPAATLGDIADTIVGGLRYSFNKSSGWSLCTIGYPVSLSNGKVGIISASHCSASKWSTDGSDMRQPYDTSSVDIGYEYWDMPPGTCPFFWLCSHYRFSDANVYEVTGRPVKVGYLARPSSRAMNLSTDTSISSASPLITVVGETSSITQNSTMDAIGATTGWTYSTVEYTCVDLYSSGLNRCSYYVQADVEGGDSGSPVFYYDTGNQTATATGIMFAKSDLPGFPHYGVFSKMMYVRNEIQSSGYTFSILDNISPPSQPSTAIIYGASNMKPGASCYWYFASSVQPNSISWSVNGVEVGTNWDLTYSSNDSFLLEVMVTDGTDFAIATKNITVSENAPTCYLE